MKELKIHIDSKTSQDIDDPVDSTYQIMGHLFTTIHQILAKHKNSQGKSNIGVGFPDYYNHPENRGKLSIGRTLSLFGSEENLENLNLSRELRKLRDYIHIGEPYSIKQKEYVCFYRVRGGSGKPRSRGEIERKIRRAIKRHGYSEYKAKALYQNVYGSVNGIGFPHIKFYSQSTEQIVHLAIGKKQADFLASRFDTYGFPLGGGVPV